MKVLDPDGGRCAPRPGRRLRFFANTVLVPLTLQAGLASTTPSSGYVIGWGCDYYGQASVPLPGTGFIAISAGHTHSLGLRDDGSIVAWGLNDHSEADVPAPNSEFTAVAAGGHVQCPEEPADCFVVGHSLGLKSDGSVVQWGAYWGEVPAPNADFAAIATAAFHSLGLKRDGSIVAWGANEFGQLDVPTPNADFVAVACGGTCAGNEYYCAAGGYSLGLKGDGSIVQWGAFLDDVPTPNAQFVAISAGPFHTLGLKANGSVVGWGRNDSGQIDVPAPNVDFVAIAAGQFHSLGLKADGSIVAWGDNREGQLDVPSPNHGVITIAAGGDHSLAIVGDGDADRVADSIDNCLTVANPDQRDTDGDEVGDSCDDCPQSTPSATVVIDECDSGVVNRFFDDGCTMADRIETCGANARNHGALVTCMSEWVDAWSDEGVIAPNDTGRLVHCAARSGVLIGRTPTPGRSLIRGVETEPVSRP